MAKDEAFCIELNTGPLYLGTEPETCHNGKENFQQLDAVFDNMKNVFYVSAFAHGNQFAKNISQHEKLEKVLKSSLSSKSEIIPGLSYNGDNNFERGYFVKVPCDTATLAAKVKEDIKEEQVEISSFQSLTLTPNNGVLIENEVFFKANDNDMPAKWELTVVAPCSVHPAFLSRNTNSVYHDIQRCYDVLDEFKSREEVKELKEICGRYIRREEKLPLKAKNSVIVIEGLDATGKTTLTKSLGKHLHAKVLKSPPECVCHLRSKFDSYPQLLRRAFYSLGNYAFAKMVYDAANDGPVIIDRFWNSTAAYAIATDVGAGGRECLPPHGHWVYSWPSDLLKPSAVFLLTISDEQRRKRLKGRGSVKTDEEIRLEVSSPFRQRLEEAYNRMENPSMLKIDASGTEEDVLDKTMESLKSHGLI